MLLFLKNEHSMHNILRSLMVIRDWGYHLKTRSTPVDFKTQLQGFIASVPALLNVDVLTSSYIQLTSQPHTVKCKHIILVSRPV